MRDGSKRPLGQVVTFPAGGENVGHLFKGRLAAGRRLHVGAGSKNLAKDQGNLNFPMQHR